MFVWPIVPGGCLLQMPAGASPPPILYHAEEGTKPLAFVRSKKLGIPTESVWESVRVSTPKLPRLVAGVKWSVPLRNSQTPKDRILRSY